MDNEDAPVPHFLLRPQRVLSFPRHSPHSQHLQRCPIHSGLSQTTAPQPSGLLQATLRLNPNPKGFGGYRRTVTPSLPTQDQAPWRSPDSDGDAGAAVALLLVLPTATPHQDVAVLQLLCCCYRQPRAALPARGDRRGGTLGRMSFARPKLFSLASLPGESPSKPHPYQPKNSFLRDTFHSKVPVLPHNPLRAPPDPDQGHTSASLHNATPAAPCDVGTA